jgi:hypothetical protein
VANHHSLKQLLWTLHQDEHTYTCELQEDGVGLAILIHSDADVLITRRYRRRPDALEWAEQQRQALAS